MIKVEGYCLSGYHSVNDSRCARWRYRYRDVYACINM